MITEKLGKKIQELRINNTHLSQEKFALSIGLDRTYISSIERGKRNVSILNLEKIAKGLNVSLSELLKGVD